MLSRGGLELNEIWRRQAALVESDAQTRRLERAWSASPGDREARGAYHRHLLRTGQHQELIAAGGGHKLPHMKPHIAAYERDRQGLEDARNLHSRRGNTPENRARVQQARDALTASQSKLHSEAEKLGHPGGAFLAPKEDETHWHHMDRVADAHGRTAYSWGQEDRGNREKVHFYDTEEDRDAAHKALSHHYGKTHDIIAKSRDEHGTFFDGAMAQNEEPHRVHVIRRKDSPSFDTLHAGDEDDA